MSKRKTGAKIANFVTTAAYMTIQAQDYTGK